MRVAIVGAGGVGGYFGGAMARAGHEVVLLARGEHRDAIRSRGLEVREPEGAWTARGRRDGRSGGAPAGGPRRSSPSRATRSRKWRRPCGGWPKAARMCSRS